MPMITASRNGAAAVRVGQFMFRFPKMAGLDQDEEFGEVKVADAWQRIRLHDYNEIYNVPGLYEALFYVRLKCCSPWRVLSLLVGVLSDFPQSGDALRVLDVGAGNGMMGQEMRNLGALHVAGVDIIPEARSATERDRPGVYDHYLIADLTQLGEDESAQLREARLNCLT